MSTTTGTPALARRVGRMGLRKSLAQIEAETDSHGLKRSLGALNLTMLGIGSTIGAGIYVMTGAAAANYAGPAILVSFLVACLACVFTALSYGELASTMPVSGSAYTYAYASMGEVAAWVVGWLLLLEYGISCAGVAAGFSGYATSLLHDFGVNIPDWYSIPFVQTLPGPHGTTVLDVGHGMNLVGAFASVVVTVLLVIGVSESATVNSVIVVLKVSVLLVFTVLGISAIHPANWTPFVPPNEGGFRYGIPGIFRAASVIFFAYVGFEAVSTASAEAKNPKRDVPVGIITSLGICTVIYVCVAAVMTGVVPYKQLGVADPLAIAVDAMHQPWLALFVKIGAVTGLCSVMLVLQYGQSRIFFTMARDGLLPRVFCVLHPRFRTPWLGTILLGLGVATATAPAADRHHQRPGQPGHHHRVRHRLLHRDLAAQRRSRTQAALSGAARRAAHPRRLARHRADAGDRVRPGDGGAAADRHRARAAEPRPGSGLAPARLRGDRRAVLPSLRLPPLPPRGGYRRRALPGRTARMLNKRIGLIIGLMIVGFIIASISVWVLAFNANSSNVPAWTGQWLAARLPILVGVLMVVAGFRLLSSTRVPRPASAPDDDPAP